MKPHRIIITVVVALIILALWSIEWRPPRTATITIEQAQTAEEIFAPTKQVLTDEQIQEIEELMEIPATMTPQELSLAIEELMVPLAKPKPVPALELGRNWKWR